MLEKDKRAFLKGVSKRDQGYWGGRGWVAVLNWMVRGRHTEKGKDKTYENRKEVGGRGASQTWYAECFTSVGKVLFLALGGGIITLLAAPFGLPVRFHHNLLESLAPGPWPVVMTGAWRARLS